MSKYSEEVQQQAQKLRLIDDALFRLAAARREVCQEILQTLLDDKDLEVLSVVPQKQIVSLFRTVILDVLCRGSDGDLYNIEVQKGSDNDDRRRVRFYASSITANNTPKGAKFADVPNVMIVYITEYDALENGKTVTVVRRCQQLREGVYKPVEDGECIIFANTVVNDNSDKSELLQLFLQDKAFDSSKFPELSNAVKYFKDDRKGREEVCEIVESYAKSYAESYAEEKVKEAAKEKDILVAKASIAKGLDNEFIMQVTDLSEEEIENLRKQQ